MASEYSFRSRWDIPASRARCWRELERMLKPGRVPADWWPGVTVPEAPTTLAPGSKFVLSVRSPVGYKLRARLAVSEIVPGRLVRATSAGDLDGSGEMTLDELRPELTVIQFKWDVSPQKKWMNATDFLLRPVFTSAHDAVMKAGERGLTAAVRA